MKYTISDFLSDKKYVRISDKLIVFSVKIMYLGIRMILLILGRKKRNEIFLKHNFALFTMLHNFFPNRLFLIHMPGANCKAYVKTGSSYEDEGITELFNPKENDIVIDVGAHIGKYTLKAGHLIGNSGQIISLEPNPETFKILVKNIKFNKINALPLNIAASNSKGKTKFYLADYRGEDSIIISSPDFKFFEVNTDTLDNIIQSLNLLKVDWIKIDVQGAEEWVLEGAQNIIQKNRNLKLIIEIHEEKYGKPIKEILKKAGFNYKIFSRPTHPTNYHILASRSE